MTTSVQENTQTAQQSKEIDRRILCSGYLYKKPEKNILLWKKRYCILYESELTLYYYENEMLAKNNELRGKIPFSSIHNWDGKPNGFQFFTPTDQCFRVYAETEEESKKWKSMMQACINDSPEKVDGHGISVTRPKSKSLISPEGAESTNISHMPSWRGESVDLASLYQEMEDLRNEVTSLRLEVKAHEKVDSKLQKKNLSRKKSILDDGTSIPLNPVEIERMHQIFNLFDNSNSGYISADNLQLLHTKLGEPISHDEAVEALKFINPVDDKVDFTSFMKWWNEDHKLEDNASEQMKRYKAKFKFIKARIANPGIARIETETVGPFPSFEFRLNFYYCNPDNTRIQISPWHDIPLYNSDGTVNFICEIPKWTRKKFEIATGEPYNPIKQDTKNGKLREYSWGDMMFNYGALPQTWEDPGHITEGTGCVGDNDPIDVVEIGAKQWGIGSIVQVKILGVLALIDSNETDWKLIAININDPYASKINDVADVEAHMPGCITAIHDWLRDYKLPTANTYGYDGKCMNKEFAESCIAETHEFWKQLIEERGGQATV